MPQGEQVLVAGDDDIGIRRQSRFDEAVVVGIPGDSDRLVGVIMTAAGARNLTSSSASRCRSRRGGRTSPTGVHSRLGVTSETVGRCQPTPAASSPG
jgi:hypothetical protein